MDRRWMYNANRYSRDYIDGVSAFLRAAEENKLHKKTEYIHCPCIDCKNEKMFSDKEHIHLHLIRRGFVLGYTRWTRHGEEENIHEGDNVVDDGEGIMAADIGYGSDEDRLDIDDDNNLAQMLRDAEGNYTSQREFNQFKGLLDDSDTPLFPGCKEEYTKLHTVLSLLKLKASNGWSDKSFTALLHLLADMLPDGNVLPITTYLAKKVVCPLGLEVERIHACPNDCILYRKEYSDMHVCPVCKSSRYKRKGHDIEGTVLKKGAPAKVVWYLPVIPRLKRFFGNKKHAQLMRWHSEERKRDGKLRHPADSAQWRTIDRLFRMDFGNEPRNIRFGLSTDGMNPFGNMSSIHSTWPVTLCIYNLPPWLCMKRKYIMMSLLIQGPRQPGNDIDVYLQPLVEDLVILWNEGVQVWDEYKREYFTLRALLFCTINDFPALGNLCGRTVKGAKACPQCMDETASVWLNNSRKTVYMRHRRFLRRNHPYRNMKKQFDGTKEDGLAPRPRRGEEVYDMVKDINVVLGKGDSNNKSRSRTEKTTWKKRSIFWNLPYWKDLEVRHCIDVMHVEKNVCDSLIGLLLNIPSKTKDGLKARRDLEDMKIRAELHPQDTGKGRLYLPPACYTLSKKERTDLCKCLHGVKVPSGYSASIKKLVSMKDLKLTGMKSHDCHVMMTQMLPIAIRGILPEKVREAIMRLCFFFNAISQKVIDPIGLSELQNDVVKTLCQLEMYFPPSFFDIMVHLIVHLVNEINICGPVFLHQMYPFERYMGILKKYVRNRSRPEGSIVEGYATEEVIEFCVDYMEGVEPVGVPVSRHEGRLAGKGTIGRNSTNSYDHGLFEKAHFTVLQQSVEVSSYMDMHKDKLRQENRGRSEVWVTKEHNRLFNHWFKEHMTGKETSVTLRWLAKGPSGTILTWQGYDINGYTFYTRSQDSKSTYQNSGVRIDAYDSTGSKKSSFYGFIEEIWELDYCIFKIPMFRCRWVQLPKGVKVDKYGFTTLDIEHVGYRDEPFVLAKQVAQVFYVIDPADKKRHVVLQGKRRIVGVENVVDEDEYNQFDELPPFVDGNISLEEETTHEATYHRDDHEEGQIVKENN